ncbi:MAG: helix-turn-helix transcriptional regulator [Chloroflexi bacterium]|nr:helix-turn-helix transcriptional regulator [Chloroflexota bacterium]
MTSEETITLTRTEYDALVSRNDELEDRPVALEADDGTRVPHEVALAIIRGQSPILAYRNHQGLTLRDLSDRTGIAASYLSEIERGLKNGSASALAKIARALGTTIDTLVIE